MIRRELHARVAELAHALDGPPTPELAEALGYYASVARAFDRAAEHVLAAARPRRADHSTPLDGAEEARRHR